MLRYRLDDLRNDDIVAYLAAEDTPLGMVETLRREFNANGLCLHHKDLTVTAFVYERVRHEGRCVKLRLLRYEGAPVSLRDWVTGFRSQTPACFDKWTATYKRKALDTAVKELCCDVLSMAKTDQFPAAKPNRNVFNFRNGMLRFDDELRFHPDTWECGLYCKFTPAPFTPRRTQLTPSQFSTATSSGRTQCCPPSTPSSRPSASVSTRRGTLWRTLAACWSSKATSGAASSCCSVSRLRERPNWWICSSRSSRSRTDGRWMVTWTRAGSVRTWRRGRCCTTGMPPRGRPPSRVTRLAPTTALSL